MIEVARAEARVMKVLPAVSVDMLAGEPLMDLFQILHFRNEVLSPRILPCFTGSGRLELQLGNLVWCSETLCRVYRDCR